MSNNLYRINKLNKISNILVSGDFFLYVCHSNSIDSPSFYNLKSELKQIGWESLKLNNNLLKSLFISNDTDIDNDFLTLFNGPTIIFYTQEENIFGTYNKFASVLKPFIKENTLIPLTIKYSDQFYTINQINKIFFDFKKDKKVLMIDFLNLLTLQKRLSLMHINKIKNLNLNKINKLTDIYANNKSTS